MKKSSIDRRNFLKGAAAGAAALAANSAIVEARQPGAQQAAATPAPGGAMRTVTLEEHFSTSEVIDAVAKAWPGDPLVDLLHANQTKLLDVGSGRLAEMDASRIDVQVIALQGVGMDRVDAATATSLLHDTNDILSSAVQAHPDRFAGFATVAMQDPAKAAQEFERCVRQLHFKGVMVNGITNGLFLDHPSFAPVLETAQALDVPIYLHPGLPPTAVKDAYYGGLMRDLAFNLAGAGWGWHVEAGMHCIRLIVSGVFDRYPRLKIIIGHMGESVPFFLIRTQGILAPRTKNLQRSISDYFRENVWITTSGFFSLPPFLCALEVVGADRILFSVDHPFSPMPQGRAFLDTLPVSPHDLGKIAHGNAEGVLKL
jgi:uncharacterized protein